MGLSDVRQFLDQHETCVISTVGENSQPESATVGFSVDGDFTIMIATNEKTRKAQNLQVNNKVALVIGFEGPKTVQLEGVARLVDPEVSANRINLHFEKVPGAKKFANDTGQNHYLIAPTWLRFTDYTKKPATFETKDFS